MARTKYPPIRASGCRPNGQTPPEKMSRKECYEWMVRETIIAAEAIGAVPKVKQDESQKETSL